MNSSVNCSAWLILRIMVARTGREGHKVEVSIVIPTLNEADTIQAQVRRCLALSPSPEVIVADGASADETAGLARLAGACTLACERRGRAHQMNAGAARAAGDIL